VKEPLVIAYLVVDDRTTSSEVAPLFGAAPTALLEGLALLDDLNRKNIDQCGLQDTAEFENCAPAPISALGGADMSPIIHIISCVKHNFPAPIRINNSMFYHQIKLPKWSFLRMGYLGPILSVGALLKKIRPTILHAQGTESWCAMAGLFAPCLKFLTLHGCIRLIDRQSVLYPRWYWLPHKFFERICLYGYNAIFCNSSYVHREISLLSKMSWIVPNAIRKQFMAPLIPRTQKSGIIRFLNVGVVQERKQQVQLCSHARALFESGVSLHFRFIGRLGTTDPYSIAFRKCLEHGVKHGYLDHVPHMDTEELIQELHSADALIHCPKEEAFGLVAAEALARGLKLFVSNVGGLLDVTEGCHDVCFHEPGDWSTLRRQISAWIEEGATQPSPTDASLTQSRYSPAAIAAKHLDVYQMALACDQNY